MSPTDRHSAARTRRLLGLLAIAAASAGAGFAVGRHPDADKVAHFAASVAPVESAPPVEPVAPSATPSHDDSVPDTADTLSHEKLRDSEPSPNF
jgi:hypothetical protein